MHKKCEVPLEKLTKKANLDKIKFQTTDDIDALNSVIGQERAVSSINFAIEIGDAGYNVFVTGSYGTGRSTIVKDLLLKAAKKRPAPPDLIFVYNFENEDEPAALSLPAGRASKFQQDMQRLINSLKIDLKKTFESKSYLEKKNEIVENVQSQKQDLLDTLEKEASSLKVQIQSSSMGFVTIPVNDKGEAIEKPEFQALPDPKKEQINQNLIYIQKRIQDVLRQIGSIERSLQDEVEGLTSKVAQFVVNNHFTPLLEKYHECAEIIEYLHKAAEDIINNVYNLIDVKSDEESPKNELDKSPSLMNKYKVNVLIDNSKQKGAPVIHETNPTYNNMFGRIEKKSFQGFVYTDFTMIKAGSLLAANGGFYIIDADQLLRQSFAYDALKRALRTRSGRIEDISELYGYLSATTLKPQSFPLEVKVVLIGNVSSYHMLHNYDEEFKKIFKVRADFDTEVNASPSIEKKYVQFISRVVIEENLLPFDREGVAAIIEYGFRSAEHQKKVSLQFGELVKLIREASFWAAKKRHHPVSRRDVEYAISDRRYRHNLVEEKIHESIIENTINVDVSGFKIGQINGLAVYNLGDYSFGRPNRITINTYIGSRGIINIEREAKMSGRIHDKGILVLTGYFSQRFGSTMPLSFSASITFEQSYGMIDGDSASSTELYGLLSSLSEIPVNQGIAVTGSVNQKGEVQAIGGVNEKIEGYFQVCKARGLKGDQGVIIPKSNIKHLLLNQEVVQAVKNKKFTIWAVDNIEDGMRILTGKNCGILHKDGTYTRDSIFAKVQERLREFAQISHKFRKSLGSSSKRDDKSDESSVD
ncbi:MAG: Lon protease family protein [Calditrichaceae bacterium]